MSAKSSSAAATKAPEWQCARCQHTNHQANAFCTLCGHYPHTHLAFQDYQREQQKEQPKRRLTHVFYVCSGSEAEDSEDGYVDGGVFEMDINE
jgi:membrane protease subunit (stomatin/prohibitin family)